MKEFFKQKKWKIDNSGVALITVIAVIGFISILATIILYVTGKNYYMKTTDINIKASFYTAETAMEKIKADLLAMSNDAFCEAYKDTMVNYVAVSDQTTSESNFKAKFVSSFETVFDNKLTAYMTETKPYEAYFKTVVGTGYADGLTVDSATLTINAGEGHVIIEDFKLQYTSAEGYDTIIETDFMIKAPSVYWGAFQSKADYSGVADPTDLLTRETHDIADTVMYYNWEKR